jgi:hypothetical protein
VEAPCKADGDDVAVVTSRSQSRGKREGGFPRRSRCVLVWMTISQEVNTRHVCVCVCAGICGSPHRREERAEEASEKENWGGRDADGKGRADHCELISLARSRFRDKRRLVCSCVPRREEEGEPNEHCWV